MSKLIATVVDESIHQPVAGLDVQLLDANEKVIETQTTDGSGQVVFEVLDGLEFIVRQEPDFGAPYSVCGKKLLIQGDVSVQLDAAPIDPNADHNDFYLASLGAFQTRLSKRLQEAKGDPKLIEEAHKELARNMVILALMIAKAKVPNDLTPFGPIRAQLLVPCTTCSGRCQKNPIPDYNTCVYRCWYEPQPCY